MWIALTRELFSSGQHSVHELIENLQNNKYMPNI